MTSRLVVDVDEEVIDNPLAPFVFLKTDEEPIGILDSLKLAIQDFHLQDSYLGYVDFGDNKYVDFVDDNKDSQITKEQFLAIYLYSCEMSPREKSIYYLLNKDLTNKDRSVASKWRFYLHHFFEGFKRIPPSSFSQDLYRGVGIDVVSLHPDKYKVGKKIIWNSCTSTTTKLKVISSFLSNSKGKKTIFSINSVTSGRSISKISAISKEEEILLPPGSRFEIISVLSLDSYFLIQMKQIPPLEKQFEVLQAATLLPGEDEFVQSYQFLSKSDWKNCLPFLEISSHKKFFFSFVFLSYLWESGGLIGPKDKTKAQHFLNESEKYFSNSFLNSSKHYIQSGLGLYFFLKKDYLKAAQSFEKASNQNDPFAQYWLGFCYDNGEGVIKDSKKAAQLFEQSANQGSAMAQGVLGVCYKNGDGVTKDLEKAIQLYEQSANQGNANAQFNLGVCYKNGDGVTKDLKKAIQLYEQSANQGNANAQFNLGVCYYKGDGVTEDLNKAFQLYEQSANQGHVMAQYNLGIFYKNGYGVTKDLTKAIQLFEYCANQGDQDAKNHLIDLKNNK